MTNTTSQTLTPGANLTVEGIPPIPNTLAEMLRRYTESRAALFADWHPVKRELLIRTRFADTMQVHTVAFPGGDRQQKTFFADAVGEALYEPADGDFVVFSKDTGGNEFAQNYRLDLADGQITRLTDGTSKNSLGVWDNSGVRMAYTSTRRTGKDVDLYLVAPDDPSSDILLVELDGGGWFPLDWSEDDQRILVMEYVSINESYLWLVHPETGDKTPLTPKGRPKVSYKHAQFALDGSGSVLVLTDKDAEFARLMRLDIETQALSPLMPDLEWGVEEFALSWGGTQIAFTTNEDGMSVLRLYDPKTRAVTVPSGIPSGILGGLKWHTNEEELAFGVNSARSPSDVYSLNVNTQEVTRWTQSETGGLNAAAFQEPALVCWNSFDGREISGFLTQPDPAKFPGKRPVIIVIHGGPEGQARPGYLGQSNYYVNELGVALLYPNVRGSDGYGKTFLDLDNGFKREDTYKDIGALLDWISGQPDLDPTRIMVSGGSYGGHMTLAVATLYSGQIACSVDIVGMSNLVTFLENTEGYRRDLRRVEYGDERDPAMREFLTRIAPLINAGKIGKPLFIIQGENDPRVPASEALQMRDIVRQNAVPVWFLMADDEGHGFAKKKNIEFQFCATVQFVQTFLLNEGEE